MKNSIKILIIDDGEADRNLFKLYLKKSYHSEYSFFEADSREEAFKILHKVTPDCILVDYMLPDTSGIELLCEFRSPAYHDKYQFVPIVLLTGQGDEKVAVEAMKMGAQDYLVKNDINQQILNNAVHSAINKFNLAKHMHLQNQEKEEFLAVVSHDLKNPLSVIQSSMDLILNSGPDALGQENFDLIRRSKKNAKRALELITNLLDQARMEGEVKLSCQKFHLKDLILECVDNFKFKLEKKKIKVRVNFEANYVINADYGRIAQVITNLIGNACKFTPKGGRIDIGVDSLGNDEKDNKKSSLKITIADNGPGIPSEKLKEIFFKFKQANASDRKMGVGLGLAISRRICELHNGSIWATSELGKGASFCVTLPDAQEVDSLQPQILVIDDTADVRVFCDTVLSDQGYLVITAANGEEGLEKLTEGLPDLVLLDMEMPVISGRETLSKIRANEATKNLTVLIFTSHDAGDQLDELIEKADGYLQKPASKHELESKIAETLLSKSMPTSNDRQTILLVDDEEDLRMVFAEQLELFGYNVLLAKNGLEALFLVKKFYVHLVITDISMPIMDGKELCGKLKDIFPNLPIILFSGHFGKTYPYVTANNKLNQLADAFINKPVAEDSEKIKDLIEQLMKKYCEKMDDAGTKAPAKVQDDEYYFERILLADDSEDYRHLMRIFFQDVVDLLDVARNGAEAVKMVLEHKYDLVLMDVNMPIMNGIEATKKIRKLGFTLPIIALTAHSGGSHLEQVREAGMNDFIQKPIKRASLKEKLMKYK